MRNSPRFNLFGGWYRCGSRIRDRLTGIRPSGGSPLMFYGRLSNRQLPPYLTYLLDDVDAFRGRVLEVVAVLFSSYDA